MAGLPDARLQIVKRFLILAMYWIGTITRNPKFAVLKMRRIARLLLADGVVFTREGNLVRKQLATNSKKAAAPYPASSSRAERAELQVASGAYR